MIPQFLDEFDSFLVGRVKSAKLLQVRQRRRVVLLFEAHQGQLEVSPAEIDAMVGEPDKDRAAVVEAAGDVGSECGRGMQGISFMGQVSRLFRGHGVALPESPFITRGSEEHVRRRAPRITGRAVAPHSRTRPREGPSRQA